MTTVLATLLALVAALLVGASAVLQQTAASTVRDRGAGFFAALLRRRRWLAGAAADTAGFGFLLAARAVGPLLLVQPIAAASVLVALVGGARAAGRAPRRGEVVAGGVLAVALAVFVVLGRPERGLARVPVTSWLPFLVGVAALSAGAALAVRRRGAGAGRAVLLGVPAALAYGLGAALTTTVVALAPAGIPALLGAWETWTAAVVLLAGTAAQQLAYRAGPLPASLPVVAAGEPVVAAVLGVAVLGESLAAVGPALGLTAVAVIVMLATVVVLARGVGTISAAGRPRPGRPSAGTPTSGTPSRGGSR
ncbi:DMT family transporter [Actinomycetospora sp. C-140]